MLNRMAGIFPRRGFNIQSVSLLETTEEGSDELHRLTRMATMVACSANLLGQARKQLEKLIDVVKVSGICIREAV